MIAITPKGINAGILGKYCQIGYAGGMPTMNVSLPEDLSAFVAEQLEHGYNNQSEVVRDALRLLRARNQKLQDLRASIAEGDADVRAGRVRELMRDVIHEIAERAREHVEGRVDPI